MSKADHHQSQTFLTFYLDDELFGLNIDMVREVLEYKDITRVPMTADFMRGVINVRGSVVPVIDLRRKFGFDEIMPTVHTCIIIMELDIDGERAVMGALVDGVQEVLDITAEQIDKSPRLGSRMDTRFLTGIARLGEQFVILLDMPAVFSLAELSGFMAFQQEAAKT